MEKVIPNIEKIINADLHFTKIVNIGTFGLPESLVNERLKSFSDKFQTIKLGLHAVFPEIYVKLYGKSKNKKLLKTELKNAKQWSIKKLEKYVFSDDGTPIEVVVGKLLLQKKSTISIAESCTGGLIANRLTNVAGSSNYFLFSGVTYSNEAKVNVLGVSPDTIKKYGAVSIETAKEMALGVKKFSGSTFAVSTSGIAGPGGGTNEKPVGTVCIGIATPDEVRGLAFKFSFNNRLMNKKIFAITALNQLRRTLL